ncbi:hypothetical protein J27TS8_27430 [Robertmurraya siralis]|uniref:Uncharacterized protein n=1 Tax=Robertmurraya siralis TaxID=77777 RepID=A0A920BU12_9BACI|nr:hypothetical protein [Robertmurraya siralis]GIN62750.1 hypothetical protein J27TS8_27430 [Robertmurraya siralis]
MYEVLTHTPTEIAVTYIVVFASCALTYPITKVLFNAVGKGLSKWR